MSLDHAASPLRLSVLVQEPAHQRRPDRNGIGRADQEMPIAAERGQQMVFGTAAGGGKSLMHPFGQGGAEERVILGIDPQHWHARGAAELAGYFDKLVRGAIVVWLSVDTAAAACFKGDDGLDRRRVQAGQRYRRPTAGGLTDHDD